MDGKERDGRWIQTRRGGLFWPLDPRPEDIWLSDITQALAMKCRFAGHVMSVRHFYSVAQHSCLVASILPPEHAAWGLMHDAAEAYLPDVSGPIKSSLVGFAEIEGRLLRAIAQRFGLSWPIPSCVKDADVIALATEQRDLMHAPSRPWAATEGVEPLPETIVPLPPPEAAEMFRRRACDLVLYRAPITTASECCHAKL